MCFNCFGMSKICFKCASKALSWPSIVLGCFRYVAVTTRDAEGQEDEEEKEEALGWAMDKIFFFKDVPLLLLKAIISHCHEDALMANPSDNKCFVDSGWRRQGCISGRFKSKIKGSVGQTILHWVRKAWQRI